MNRFTYVVAFFSVVAALWAGAEMQRAERLNPLAFAGPILMSAGVLVALHERNMRAR